MLKHLMSGSSLLAIALREGENDNGNEQTEREKLRAQIAKDTGVTSRSEHEKNPPNEPNEENEDDDEGDEDENEDDEEDENEEAQLTPEQIKEKEAADKIAAKAKRKEDRIQKRINEITAGKNAAEAEVTRLKAQLEADPDKKLNPEEIEARANAIAEQKLREKELEGLQASFDAACAKLRKDAIKIDEKFDDNVADMAEQFGPIPSFMIGVLEDFENGGEVLAFLAKDDDEAERIYDLKKNPAKMTKELVLISNKLIAAKLPPRRQISKVGDTITPVTNGRSQSLVITEADTKNMNNYVAKRIKQREAQKKARGY